MASTFKRRRDAENRVRQVEGRRAALIYQHATEQRDREIAAYLDEAIPEP